MITSGIIWQDVFINMIIGLVTGSILVFFGFFVWKNQVNYQKKIDLYFRAVSTISFASEVIIDILIGYKWGYLKALSSYESNIETFRELRKLRSEFERYFYHRYAADFETYLTIIRKLIDNENFVRCKDISEKDKDVYWEYLLQRGQYEYEIINEIQHSSERILKIYDVKKMHFSKESKKNFKEEKKRLARLKHVSDIIQKK